MLLEKLIFDHESLKKWFHTEKRDLPWRETSYPYAIWVSEIMLQQTQVSVVIPYFEKWMQAFPTIEKLATSPLDRVIKAWEGLGYYSRARNLHAGAKFVLENYNGKLPDNENDLKKIKGIGPYTVGAIMSFAFHKKKAAVDGNVIRVLSRIFNITDDIARPKTITYIRELAEHILPEHEPWIISEALIELGATVCSKKPKCLQCPLKNTCKAFLEGNTDSIPFKSTTYSTENLFRNVAIVIAENKLLVKRGLDGKVMSGLYEFPFMETKLQEENTPATLSKFLNLSLKKVMDLDTIKHSFTRFQAHLNPVIYLSKKVKMIPDCEWLSVGELDKLAFSAGHKKLFNIIKTLKHLHNAN
jgi:A/G-specific adenine glycosylase